MSGRRRNDNINNDNNDNNDNNYNDNDNDDIGSDNVIILPIINVIL